jgi:hypothetical protein
MLKPPQFLLQQKNMFSLSKYGSLTFGIPEQDFAKPAAHLFPQERKDFALNIPTM